MSEINDNLEQQAQAIFKSWFVDFEPFRDGGFVESELGMIPQGWRVGKLEDIANIVMGQSPAGHSYNEFGDGCVFYQGRTEFGTRFPKIRLFTSEPKRMAKAGDILLSVRAPVGDINVATKKCCIGRGLAALCSKNETDSFLLYSMLHLKPKLEMFNGEGTVFGCINKDDLCNISVLVPQTNVVQGFDSVASSFDREIKNNFHQTEILSNLRDTLLPKLMSGELSVEEAERQL
jgi:type I restriction enzyme S subunit